MDLAQRPLVEEYAPYYGFYIEQVPDGDILATLIRQGGETHAAMSVLTEAAGEYRYAPGKWSVKEVLGHMADTELIFSNRLLRFARGDREVSPSFDEDPFVAAAGFDRLPVGRCIDDHPPVFIVEDRPGVGRDGPDLQPGHHEHQLDNMVLQPLLALLVEVTVGRLPFPIARPEDVELV